MSELPPGWESATIGKLCTLVNGMAFKPTDWTERGRPIIRIQNLNQPASKFNFFDGVVADRFIVEPGDLLFAWSGTPGTSFGAHVWGGAEAVLNQHIFNVRFDGKQLDKQFLRLAINERLDELVGKAHGGAGLAHVTKGRFEETMLPVPPLAEQRRIVAKIDALTARSKRARADLQRGAALSTIIRAELLRSIFEGIGAPIRHLKEITSKIGSGATPRGGRNVYLSEGMPFIRSQNVRFEGFDQENLALISNEAATQLKSVSTSPGDVLLNITGASIGRTCQIPVDLSEARVSQHVCIIRPSSELEPRFLCAYLSTPDIQNWINSENYGATRQALTKSMIEAIQVPLPSLAEQRAIVARIETAFAALDRVEAEARAAERALDRLDQAILAKAFRGELTPQDPADKPASALLARIAAERAAAPKPARGRRARAAP